MSPRLESSHTCGNGTVATLVHPAFENRYRQATDLQTSIGMARDVVQANLLAVKVQADLELAEFLRGVAVGQERSG